MPRGAPARGTSLGTVEPTVLVPLRADGKSRLAERLGVEARRVLAEAMLVDVVAAVRGAGLTRVVLVAGGAAARAMGLRLGLEVIDDPADDPDDGDDDAADDRDDGAAGGPGLDRALAHAGRRVGGDTLVLAADLPALTPDDVAAVLAARTPVVVAPTRDGGTAALLRRPDSCLAPAYGVGSAARHLAAAATAGLSSSVVERLGLAHDVDRAEDLEAPAGLRFGAATTAVLSGLSARGPRDG